MKKEAFRRKKGIALILVVSILTVVAITVVSFIFTMRLENRAASNFLWQEKAGYIAQAGLVHAKAILDEDKANSPVDTYEDAWRSSFVGADIDNNDDGTSDSSWIELSLDDEVIGRYAVLVEDEAAKVNINTAGYHNESRIKAIQGATPFEVGLADFFSAKGVSSAEAVAQCIINWRYGQDNAPGAKSVDDNQNQSFLAYDGIDNDADGEIDQPAEGTDEPAEFIASNPFGDDRAFLTINELQNIDAISSSIYDTIKAEITAHSSTKTVDRNRDLQKDINSIDAQDLLDVFLASGITEPWQKVVNVVDYADSDFAQSVVIRAAEASYTQDQGPKGDWQWMGDHYQSKTYGGISGLWLWADLTPGEYFLILHGAELGQPIGDVTIGDLTQTNMTSGKSFSIFPSGTISVEDAGEGVGSLTLSIQNNEELGTTCYFKYIELVSSEGRTQGDLQEVRGVEGIRINEFMPRPVIDLATDANQTPGGDWVWQSGHYANSSAAGGARGQGTWIWEDIPDGEYYLTVFGTALGDVVGDVLADGTSQDIMHSGDRFTEHEAVTVSAGVFRLDIQNNLTSGTCYFKSATLSQQPDAEYIELINLTPNDVSLDGWSIEASGTDGWPASIPLGTTIKASDYLILAVDKEDSCPGVNGNGISFENVWGALSSAQLDFTRSLANYSDMIDDEPLGVGTITLRDARGNIVDTQNYSPSAFGDYVSLERADPTSSNTIWLSSTDLSAATPGRKNNNSGIIEVIDEETIEHTLDEVALKNAPMANLGELAQVSNGFDWEKLETDDLVSLADRLTTYSLRLEAEGYKASGDFSEKLRTSPHTSWFESQNPGEVGTWLWSDDARIPNGVYSLYFYGDNGRAFSVSLHLADDSWTSFTPALTPGASNGVFFGRIEIGAGSTNSLPSNTLEMRIKNASADEVSYFDYIRLAPVPEVSGKININTASAEVLSSLPLIDEETASSIISGRPYGNQEDKGRGIGDILATDVLDSDADEKIAKFSAVSNLITVRSDSYQIIATGQALKNGRVMAEKRIRMVIER